MTATRIGALVVAIVAATPLESGAQDIPPRGWPVRIQRADTSAETRGELIAVSADTLWVLADSQLVSVPTTFVWRVLVKRRPIGAKGIGWWGLVGGTISGLGLMAACGSYDGGGDCGGVLVGTVFIWAAWTGIWAAIAGSEYSGIPRPVLETQLKPFARFPQGMPPGLEPSALVTPKPAVPGSE